MSKPSRLSWLYLPLLLAPFVLLGPALLPGRALFWGTPFLQFVPWRWTAWQMLREGHLPLWNPGVGMGAPLAANYQSALFYPPNWLQFLLAEIGGIGGLAWGQALLVALHLSWAAVGAALLARQLGLNRLAQAVSGLAFGLSGYVVARSGFLSINAAVAWLPWVLLAVLRLESQSRRSNFFVLAAVLALQLLAGHAQTAWYTLLLAGLWAGFLGWQAGLGRGTARAWARLAMAVALAVLLSAVQLFPTLEYLLVSQRSGEVGFDTAMTYSFWPPPCLEVLPAGTISGMEISGKMPSISACCRW
jgi:hypothetical protein